MGPHDLLCKWCSTFVGQGKKFCSIFCESRFTRNRRRRLANRRYAASDTQENDIQEFVSPREKAAAHKKENILDDVITALHMDTDRLPPDKSKGKIDDDSTDATSSSKTNKDLKNATAKRQIKRDFTKSGHMNRTFTKTMHEAENAQESKIPMLKSRIKTRKQDEDLHAKDETLDADFDDDKNEDDIFSTKAVRTGSLSALTSEMTIQGNTRRRTRTALVLAKRVRSSGYGVSVNPKMRPMALKPKSASRPSASDQRESSAKSKGNSNVGVSVADLLRENSRPIVTGKEDQRWEIIPSTIDEETHRTKQDDDTENVRSSLEEEDPLSGRESGKPTTRLTNRETARSELVRIEEILREESTSSDLLDQSVIQERLSSIKRKVEYRRRGMDSRSSMGSEFDAFMDSTQDLTTDRGLNTSLDASKDQRFSRLSSRAQATKTSKEYRL